MRTGAELGGGIRGMDVSAFREAGFIMPVAMSFDLILPSFG